MKYLIPVIVLITCVSCKKKIESAGVVDFEENLPAAGFDIDGSDPIAVLVADKVMNAMGGRTSWDQTRFIRWNFFGKRTLLWDKQSGHVRIDFTQSDEVLIVNVNELTGKAFKNNEEIVHPDSLANYLQRARNIWRNDSYWLVMPFKLKDSGVTLKYVGEDSLTTGKPAQLLEMTFDNVGKTPDNKYHVWVDFESNLVRQWAFYRHYNDEEASFTMPWNDYKEYGGILLSGDRGKRKLTDIQVYDEVPDEAFTSFEKVNI